MRIVGGLDIHRRQITFDYLDERSGQCRRGRIAPADRLLLRRWLTTTLEGGPAAFAVEACTGWRFVVEELQRAGVEAHLAEPADTAAARGPKRRAKTDRTDARHLRELLAAERLPESWIPPEQVLEMRARLELFRDLREEHTAWVQRIHAILLHQGAPAIAGDLLGADNRRRLEALFCDDRILMLAKDVLEPACVRQKPLARLAFRCRELGCVAHALEHDAEGVQLAQRTQDDPRIGSALLAHPTWSVCHVDLDEPGSAGQAPGDQLWADHRAGRAQLE